MTRTLLFSVTLKDCEVQHFRCGGPGGQKQNKTSSGTRIIHRASGARGESREDRSQHANTRKAFVRMAKTTAFTAWVRRQCASETPEEKVSRDMAPHNLRVEVRRDGRWVPEEIPA